MLSINKNIGKVKIYNNYCTRNNNSLKNGEKKKKKKVNSKTVII